MRLWYRFLAATFLVAFFVMIVIDWKANLIFIMVSGVLTLAVLVLKGFRVMRAIYLFLGIFFILTLYMLAVFALQKGYLSLDLTLWSCSVQSLCD